MNKNKKKTWVIVILTLSLVLIVILFVISNINWLKAIHIKSIFMDNQEAFKSIVTYIDNQGFKDSDIIEIKRLNSDYSFKCGNRDLSKSLPNNIKAYLNSVNISSVYGSYKSLDFYVNDIEKVRIEYSKDDKQPNLFGGNDNAWFLIKLCECWYVRYETNRELPPSYV